MNDENSEHETGEADSEQSGKQAAGGEKLARDSIIEVVKENSSTLQTLAHSDLPIAEDARRALAMTDGGVDTVEEETEQ
jgi:hypothetical protein